jgi:hypothetical protein
MQSGAGALLWYINYHEGEQVYSRPTESVSFRAGACGVPARAYSVYGRRATRAFRRKLAVSADDAPPTGGRRQRLKQNPPPSGGGLWWRYVSLPA